jgi:isoamylase
VSKQGELLRFVRLMIHLNRQHPALNIEMFPTSPSSTVNHDVGPPGRPETHVRYHGIKPGRPDLGYYSHSLALTVSNGGVDDDMLLIFNAFWQDLEFQLPTRPESSGWQLKADTSRPSPYDIAAPGQEQPLTGPSYPVRARSVVILIAHP